MRLTVILSLFISTTFAVPIRAFAQAPVDSDHSLGRQVALELCSSCHRITDEQPRPRQDIPTLTAIANLPSTTALSLRVFLRSNHKGMPNLIVSESDTNEIIDYILSLKRR